MVHAREYLTMGEIRRMLIQVCGAVKYMHERDVVHRDIKAGNIFLDKDMNVMLGDFGLAAIMEPSPEQLETDAKTLQHIRRTTFCGTPNYLAPEILSRKQGHGTSVDVWAIGVLAYYLSIGRAPFASSSKDEIYERLRKGEYQWPRLAPKRDTAEERKDKSTTSNAIPQDLKDLVGILLVEEKRRPKPDDIVQHPFFTQGFIPEQIEPLCKTRTPKWARPAATDAKDQSFSFEDREKIYADLCCYSKVGQPWKDCQEGKTSGVVVGGRYSERDPRSMFLVLAKEMSHRLKLEIPLQEGIVYTGRVERSKADADASKNTLKRKNTSNGAQPEAKVSDRKVAEANRVEAGPPQPSTLEQKASKLVNEQPASISRAAPAPTGAVRPAAPSQTQSTENIHPKSTAANAPITAPTRPISTIHSRPKSAPVIEILEDTDVNQDAKPQRPTGTLKPLSQKPRRTYEPTTAADASASRPSSRPTSRQPSYQTAPLANPAPSQPEKPPYEPTPNQLPQRLSNPDPPPASNTEPEFQPQPNEEPTQAKKLLERPRRLLRKREAAPEEIPRKRVPRRDTQREQQEEPKVKFRTQPRQAARQEARQGTREGEQETREKRQALQANDRSNRVRRRILDIEGKDRDGVVGVER